MTSKRLILKLALIAGVITGGTSGCFTASFFNPSTPGPLALTDGDEEIKGVAFQFDSNTPSESLHLFSPQFSITASSDVAVSSVCVKEGNDCNLCTTITPGQSFTLSSSSGLKNVSLQATDTDGNVGPCQHYTIRYTNLEAPEPAVAGSGDFSDRIYFDGSRGCENKDPLGSDCIPGGFMKRVKTAYESCDGLILEDTNGFFNWSCSVVDGFAQFLGKLRYGSKTGEFTLKDFIEESSNQFLQNSLVLTENGTPHNSATMSSAWWSDPIVDAPSAQVTTQTLNTPNTIYYLKSSQTTSHGYFIYAHGISLIANDGVTLTVAAGINNPCWVGMITQNCLIAVMVSWNTLIELPIIDGDGAIQNGLGISGSTNTFVFGGTIREMTQSGVVATDDIRTMMDEVTTTLTSDAGLHSNNSTGLRVHYFKADNAFYGIRLQGADHFGISEFRASQIADSGLSIQSSNSDLSGHGYLANIRISNSFNGIHIRESANIHAVELLLNDLTHGIWIRKNSKNIDMMQGTIARTINYGIRLDEETTTISSGITFNNFAIPSSGESIYIAGNSNWTPAKFHLRDIVTGTSTSAISIADEYYEIDLTGSFLTETGANCLDTGGHSNLNTGLCSQGASSSGLPVYSQTSDGLGNAFVGVPNVKDTGNTSSGLSNTNQLPYASVTDWLNFMTSWRAWIQHGASLFPDTPAATDVKCEASNDCKIFDFGLKSQGAGNLLRNRSLAVTGYNATTGSTSMPTRDFAHTVAQGSEIAPALGVKCPSHLLGNLLNTNLITIPEIYTGRGAQTVLKTAVEVLFDHVGDDDGWCELGETCNYTPNFGYFQGHPGSGFGYCDQSGDSVLDLSNDDFKVQGYGAQGYSL